MNRYIFVMLILILLSLLGCVKNDKHEDGYFKFKHEYLYTLCQTDNLGWPPMYDTIRYLPTEDELILVYSIEGLRCYNNEDLIFYCDMVSAGNTSYVACDDTIVMQSHLEGNVRYAHYYKLPINFIDNCGEYSYSVWRIVE